MAARPLVARQRAGGQQRAPIVLVIPALAAALLSLLPVGYLLIRSTEGGLSVALDTVLRERTGSLVLRSLGLTVTVTASCLIVGSALAWLVIRTDLPWAQGWAVVLALPLAVPSYVAAFTWVSAAPGIAGFWGAVLVLTSCCYPYVLLPVAAALQRADPALEEVSRSLGRSALDTYRRVTLRQVRPAAMAGGLLVALYVLSDFGAVSLLRYDVFTRVIYTSYRSSFDRTPAAVLSLLLVALTILITVAEARTRGRLHGSVGSAVGRAPARLRLGHWRLVAALSAGAVTAVSLGFPATSLTTWLLRGRSTDLDLLRLAEGALSTIWVSVAGAAVIAVLAVPVGVLAARHRTRSVRLLEHATFAGHALPGIVVALSLVFFGVRFAEPIYQRTPLLVLAYAVLFLPATVGAVRASVGMSPPGLEEVARGLGHRPWSVLRKVTLPLAAPGVAAGGALALLTCMKELPATLLLRPTGMDTLATRLWSATSTGSYAAAAPYAALLVVLAVVPTFLLTRHQVRLTVVSAETSAAPARVDSEPLVGLESRT